MRRLQTSSQTPTGFQSFTRSRRWVWRPGCGICSKGFSKHAFAFLRRRFLLLLLRTILARHCPPAVQGQRAGIAIPGLEALIQDLDKVGWEQADHAPVALQAAHPPRAVARIEAFNQIAFDESEVTFRLVLTRQDARGSEHAGGLLVSELTSPPHE
jgi:hypothetical protein